MFFYKSYDRGSEDNFSSGCTAPLTGCAGCCVLPCCAVVSPDRFEDGPSRRSVILASICHLVFMPVNIVWLQLVWILFGVAQHLGALISACRTRQFLFAESAAYEEATYPQFVSAMLRLSEDPLQLVANVMLMTLAPEEVGAMNVASLIFTIGMIIKTFYTLPDVLHAMYELSDGE
jgi:hypothetical protein